MFAPELFQTDDVSAQITDDHAPTIFEQQGMIPLPTDPSSSPEFMRKDSVTTDLLNGIDSIGDDPVSLAILEAKKKERSTKQRDPEKLKDTKHSSKNEGQHTDRRYLCYFCYKLFTRRRSVRDHIVKIHGEKTWEPTRSLEVIVEPHTGEPQEPIEDIVARGSQLPVHRLPKTAAPTNLTQENDEDQRPDTVNPAQLLPDFPSLETDLVEEAAKKDDDDVHEEALAILNEEVSIASPEPDPDLDLDATMSDLEVKPAPKSKTKHRAKPIPRTSTPTTESSTAIPAKL